MAPEPSLVRGERVVFAPAVRVSSILRGVGRGLDHQGVSALWSCSCLALFVGCPRIDPCFPVVHGSLAIYNWVSKLQGAATLHAREECRKRKGAAIASLYTSCQARLRVSLESAPLLFPIELGKLAARLNHDLHHRSDARLGESSAQYPELRSKMTRAQPFFFAWKLDRRKASSSRKGDLVKSRPPVVRKEAAVHPDVEVCQHGWVEMPDWEGTLWTGR